MAQPRPTQENKGDEFSLVNRFSWGYRSREDITNLPPGVLIKGSKNVLTNVSERVQIRQGYALDGDISSVAGPVLSSFQWLTRGNGERHLRAGGLTSAGNDGKLQYRYVDADGTVTWRDLLTGLTTVAYNFTKFWDTSESLRQCLFVNGTPNIFSWNGAITTVASSTATTITKEGTDSWLDAGFSAQVLATIGDSTTQFDITNPAGTTFRYTWDTTGTDPLISATTISVGSYILIGAQNFNAANNGLFVITAVGTNYFEVTNASGVVESNKTIGTGYIYKDFKRVVIIGGTAYAYTGGEDTTTLTGVTPDASGLSAGDVVHQAVITTSNAVMSGITATFENGLIQTMNNQVFLGALESPVMWLSAVNSFTNYSSSSTRQVGEGGTLILDDNLVGFTVLGSVSNPQMIVSAGTDLWYKIVFEDLVSAVGVSGQTLGAVPIKTGPRQGARSQALVSNIKNDIVSVTNEPTVDTLGVVDGYLTQLQTTNISDPIKLDMDGYDFEDGSIFYFQYFIYVAVPKEGVVLPFNISTGSWESPQELPVSRFYTVDGELYGHSYNTFESYKLFTGYADRVYDGFAGFPISAVWNFSYQNYGDRASKKNATQFYAEGYINENTTVQATVTYELDGCATSRSFTIDGSDNQYVCIPAEQGALGKEAIGKEKLGGAGSTSYYDLPPKFRVIATFTPFSFFEANFSFAVSGTDNRAEFLAFGLAATESTEQPVKIKV